MIIRLPAQQAAGQASKIAEEMLRWMCSDVFLAGLLAPSLYEFEGMVGELKRILAF